MNKIEFGKKLKELRDNKKESQLELGNLLGVGIKQIQRYENGELLPTHENLALLCNHYVYDFISLIYPRKNNETEDKVEGKYVALLEKTLNEKEADLKTYRGAIEKITSTDKKVENLTTTVYDLKGTFEEYLPIILGLREFVTDEIAALKRKSPESVSAALGIRVAEQRKKVVPPGTQQG